MNAGASSSRITNKSQMAAQASRGSQSSQLSAKKDSYGIPLNAGASSARITHRPPTSLIADATKTQELVNRPTLSNKPSYAVPNPSKISGNPMNKPKFSLVDEAMKTSQEVPRVQNTSKLQINSRNSSDVTLSQLQDIKKERDRMLDEKKAKEEAEKDFKGEIEFVDLDEDWIKIQIFYPPKAKKFLQQKISSCWNAKIQAFQSFLNHYLIYLLYKNIVTLKKNYL